MGINFSRALSSVSFAPMLRQHITGCGVAALIIGELFVRFRLTQPIKPSPELSAYKRLEIVSSGALLGLTAIFSTLHNSLGLGVIGAFAFNRLYSDFINVPELKKFFYAEWEAKPTPASGYAISIGLTCLQLLSIGSVWALARRCAIKSAWKGAALCTIPYLFCGYATYLLYPEQISSSLASSDPYFAALKVERVRITLTTLMGFSYVSFAICSAVLTNKMLTTISLHGLALPFRLLGVFLMISIGLGTVICGSLQAMIVFLLLQMRINKNVYLDMHDLNLANNQNSIHPTDISDMYPLREILMKSFNFFLQDSKNTLRSFTSKFLIYMACWLIAQTIKGGLLNRLAKGQVGEQRIRNLFMKFHVLGISTTHLVKVIHQFPKAVAPQYLVSNQQLWEILPEPQIEQFLFTPELKTAGQLDSFSSQMKNLEQTLATLETSYTEDGKIKKPLEAEWQKVFLQLRDLYEPLVLFHFTKLQSIISHLPEKAVAQDLINRLRKIKVKIDQMKDQLDALDDRIETLSGDLFKPAYESFACLTVSDIEELLQEWGEDSRTLPFLKLQTLLQQKGILWKGDLITSGILQQGAAPDNSTQALKVRLTDLLHSKKNPFQVRSVS
jgi:hypothetical protein